MLRRARFGFAFAFMRFQALDVVTSPPGEAFPGGLSIT